MNDCLFCFSMDKLFSNFNFLVVLIGVFTVFGGMFFRKTFSVLRNLVFSPVLGYGIAALLFWQGTATELGRKVYTFLGSGFAASWTEIQHTAEQGHSHFLVEIPLPEAFFVVGTVLTALIAGISISLPIRSFFWQRIQTFFTSSFIITLCISLVVPNLKVQFFFIVFLGLALVSGVFQKSCFDVLLIVETAISGCALMLLPLKLKLEASLLIYLLFVVLVSAVFIILGFILKGKPHEQKA